MDTGTPSAFGALLDGLTSSPMAALCAALFVAVVALWRRQTELEKEFRGYAQEQGAKTAALLDRATRALERLTEGKP